MQRDRFNDIWNSTSHIHQDKKEFWEFLQYVLEIKPQVVLELGASHGGTTLIWQEVASKVISLEYGRILCPDHFSQSALGLAGGIPDSWFNTDVVSFLVMDSHAPETLDFIKGLVPQVDVLFIDGDHSYEGVKQDWEMYSPLVRPGGLVGFHDIMYGRNKDPESAIRAGQVFDEIIGHEKFEILRAHGIGGVWM